MAILSDHKPHGVRELTAKAKIADPRAVIRTLRNKGVDISDEWRKNSEGVPYKVYWLVRGILPIQPTALI